MYDIALSAASHDLVIKDGDLLLINNAERVAQQIKITLLAWMGEWFLDQRFGVPYLESILKKNPNMNHVKNILQSKILAVPGVKAVNSLMVTVDREMRLLNVSYEVTTTFGLITRKEVLQYGN